MSFASNVPKIIFTDNGPVLPSDTAILAGVIADMQAAFGNVFDFTNLETPEGQLALTWTAQISDKNQQVLWQINNVDPNTASGRMQDGIGRIYYIERDPAVATVVSATIVGVTRKVVPANSQAIDLNNYTYSSVADATITDAGNVVVEFQCNTPGPIVCATGALNRMYISVDGVDTITNTAPGIVGNNAETQYDFEQRRSQSTAKNSTGNVSAVLAKVLAVANVVDAYVTDNPLSTNATKGGVSLAPHSLFVSVIGGTDADVANAIWDSVAIGCDFTGTSTYTITDTSYFTPYPTYAIGFTRPTPVTTLLNVTMSAAPANIPSDAIAQIQNAILNSFAGLDNNGRVRIGATTRASRFYGNIAALGPWAQITEIKIGNTTTGAVNDTLPTNIDQIATLAASGITVAFA